MRELMLLLRLILHRLPTFLTTAEACFYKRNKKLFDVALIVVEFQCTVLDQCGFKNQLHNCN